MPVNPWREIPPHSSLGVYTEHGLTPALLSDFLSAASEAGCTMVYDPFVGSGVVVTYFQEKCMESAGADSNPWSLLLSRAKTLPLDWKALKLWAEKVAGEVGEFKPIVPSPRLARYHDAKVLEDLGRLRALIEEAPGEWKPLLLAVLVRVAYRWSRLKRSPAPRFKDTLQATGNVHLDFFSLLNKAISELEARQFCASVALFQADSSSWIPTRLCGVVTSPPFANNIDYIRHTMLELLWSGLARHSGDLGRLRSAQIPACEAAARTWKQSSQHQWLRDLASRIGGSRAPGFKKFMLQYFHAMESHFSLISESLEWEAWYTIGDSVLGGVYIPTHWILARLAEKSGLRASVKLLGPRMKRGRTLYLLRLAPRRKR